MQTIFHYEDRLEDCNDTLTLLLRVGDNFSSLALCNSFNYHCYLCNFSKIETASNFKEWFEKNIVKPHLITNGVIATSSKKTTLIPKNVLNNENRNVFIHPNVNETLKQISFNQLEIELIYPINEQIVGYIVNNFSIDTILPDEFFLIDAGKNMQGNTLQLLFDINSFTLCANQNGKLLITQQYDFLNASDVLFYVLKIVEKLNWPWNNTKILISGLVTANSDIYLNLKNHFKYIHFSDNNWFQNFNYPSQYFTPLNRMLCAL